MIQSIYTAATGLDGQQTRLDAIASNLANVNTTGYRSQEVTFQDAMYSAMKNPAGAGGSLQEGCGVLVGATARDNAPGKLTETEQPLDFAIDGDGYFCLENGSGEKLYTRNGAFSVSHEGGGNYLVSAQGYYVLDSAGARIQLPKETEEPRVSADGSFLDASGAAGQRLGVYTFSNEEGLEAAGNSAFRETGVSGAAHPAGGYEVRQRTLESSNVDLAREMTLMIRSQRALSLASRALQTADEMEGLANRIRQS